MPLKKQVVPTGSFLNIAVNEAIMSVAVGFWTSSFQKTAKASACQCDGKPATINVAALLRLADWCRNLLATQGGSTSCPTTPDPLCPPVLTEQPTPDLPNASVDAAEPTSATRPRSPSQRPDAT